MRGRRDFRRSEPLKTRVVSPLPMMLSITLHRLTHIFRLVEERPQSMGVLECEVRYPRSG